MTTRESAIQTVGYIGLGIMGAPMAGHILDAEYDLLVHNRTAAKCQPLVERGAQAFDSPAALAEAKPDVICINVTDTPDVQAVLFGQRGIVHGASRGLVIIDHSTISPVATQQYAQQLKENGITFMDAPVSGGDVGARQATLSIMVGGPAEAFTRVEPLLKTMGRRVVHLGEAGMGQLCKACNQVCVACTLLGVVEAMALAKKGGLNLQKMIEVVGGGAGGSWQLDNLGPKIAEDDHAPGFMIDLVLKDLAIVADTARSQQLPLAGTTAAEHLFRAAAAHGHGKLGTQAMAKTLEKLGMFRYHEK